MCLYHQVYLPSKVIKSGFIRGFKYVICKNEMGYLCGYLRIDNLYSAYAKDDFELNYICHGGITFTGVDELLSHKWWIGFDCGHYNDLPDLDLIEKEYLKEAQAILIQSKIHQAILIQSKIHVSNNVSFKDINYVTDQLISLTLQLDAEVNPIKRFLLQAIRFLEVKFVTFKSKLNFQ
jgi:hypothetical protein